jgi:hypothetical protein
MAMRSFHAAISFAMFVASWWVDTNRHAMILIISDQLDIFKGRSISATKKMAEKNPTSRLHKVNPRRCFRRLLVGRPKLLADAKTNSTPLTDSGSAELWLQERKQPSRRVLVSGLSPEFLSAFDEPTLNGIIENFIASTDWHPIEQTIRVDLSLDVREYAARIKTPTLLITAKHDQIVPPAYSENLVRDAKTLKLNSGHLIFLEKPVELASAILSFCQFQSRSRILESQLGRARDHS